MVVHLGLLMGTKSVSYLSYHFIFCVRVGFSLGHKFLEGKTDRGSRTILNCVICLNFDHLWFEKGLWLKAYRFLIKVFCFAFMLRIRSSHIYLFFTSCSSHKHLATQILSCHHHLAIHPRSSIMVELLKYTH